MEPKDADFHDAGEHLTAIEKKLAELADLLHEGSINAEQASALKITFRQAIKKAANLDADETDSDEFSILLQAPNNNNRLVKLHRQTESISKYVLIALSVMMIVLGLGMIIMPAPPFFEMFTIFYFNQNDGITVMDLLSLIIVLAGVYFLIKGVYKNPHLRAMILNKSWPKIAYRPWTKFIKK